MSRELEELKYYSWLKVMHYLEVELTQGDITNATYDTLSNALLDLKPKLEVL